eukprot:scaffold12131_cov112-Isochrysis_galbana.AAC.10
MLRRRGRELSVALSCVTVLLTAGASTIRWMPPLVRAKLLTRDVRVPSDVVEAPRLVKATEAQNRCYDFGHGCNQLLGYARSLCAVMAQRSSTALS